jgi:DEAD/DEAH box helicase domain-containing protein
MLPTLILPNLTSESVYQDLQYGALRVTECAMQIGEAVVGFKERRGANELDINYPLRPELGFFYDAPKFARYVFTSGVLIIHPALSRSQVKCDSIASVIYEAFLMTVPFEPQDISAGADKLRSGREGISEGSRFACVFDQTYGSLRLTSRLMEEDVLRKVLRMAVEIAQNSDFYDLNSESIQALQELADDSHQAPIRTEAAAAIKVGSQYGIIIKPGSYGVDIKKDNEDFLVEGVFFSPQHGELTYRGKHTGEKKRAEQETLRHGQTTVIVPVKAVLPLDGVSEIAYYNYETGEVHDHAPEIGEF